MGILWFLFADAMPCAESLIANLVADYIDEGDEEDDSALDKGVPWQQSVMFSIRFL